MLGAQLVPLDDFRDRPALHELVRGDVGALDELGSQVHMMFVLVLWQTLNRGADALLNVVKVYGFHDSDRNC